MFINGLYFNQTSCGCPEQYDVFDEDNNQVGYVRLRHGLITCECPDIGGTEIHNEDLSGFSIDGVLHYDLRPTILSVIANKIKQYYRIYD